MYSDELDGLFTHVYVFLGKCIYNSIYFYVLF